MSAAQLRLLRQHEAHDHIAALERINSTLLIALVDISTHGRRYGGEWTAAKMAEVAREALAQACVRISVTTGEHHDQTAHR